MSDFLEGWVSTLVNELFVTASLQKYPWELLLASQNEFEAKFVVSCIS